MPDNTGIAVGSGTTFATDDVAGVHFDRIKLVDGTLDGTPVVAATEAGAYRVFHRDGALLTATISGMSTNTLGGAPNTNYNAGDQIGLLMTLTGAARVSGGSGLITASFLVDADDVLAQPVDIMIFSQSVTLLGGDNGVFSVSDADSLFIQCLLQATTLTDLGTNRNMRVPLAVHPVPYVCSGGTSLYACVKLPTGAVQQAFFTTQTALSLRIFVERN